MRREVYWDDKKTPVISCEAILEKIDFPRCAERFLSQRGTVVSCAWPREAPDNSHRMSRVVSGSQCPDGVGFKPRLSRAQTAGHGRS